MHIDDAQIAQALQKGGYLSDDDLASAQKAASQQKESLATYLVGQGMLTNDLLGQAVAESFGVPYFDLNSHKPIKELLAAIPEDVAKEFNCVMVSYNEEAKTASVATDNPQQEKLAPTLSELFPDLTIAIVYSLPGDIDDLFISYQKPLDTRFSKIIEDGKHVAPEILEEIFSDAYTFKASDIHFEPRAQGVLVRFRVDGVLQEAGEIPRQYYDNILNRIKVQSQLRIDEHFAAQDGSMHFEKENISFDIRTSIVPTVEGEKIVLRILAAYIRGFNLEDLGLRQDHQALVKEAAHKPFGMIVVTGPTGSGKTTTLYAILKLLHRPEVNITTIEDPVEYKVAGVNQIQVNKQTNLTFAKGLRSVVRQDPDIILVGEIRDDETSEIAVNAALTGHLLLSTFHANDAATAIPRLLDMNVEPFLLASTLEVVVGQRLVRKICDSCRHSTTMSKKELDETFPGAKRFFRGRTINLYKGKGCEVCAHTGYNGRTAIFEFIHVTPEIKELILTRPTTSEIWKLARSQGAKSLFEDGIEKVKTGVTTLEELVRVAPPQKAQPKKV